MRAVDVILAQGWEVDVNKLILFLLSSLMGWSALVAAEEDGSYTSYDSIVNELRSNADDSKPARAPRNDFNWDDVAIHGGVGFATSWESIATANGASGSGLLKGIAVNFGINLFTSVLRAEGAFSSYAQDTFSEGMRASLKEFELRMMYLPTLNSKTTLRFGLGLTARYLTVDAQNSSGSWSTFDETTPASVFMLGFERKLTANMAIGPDLSYRSALVSDTIDKSAWNATFRLNATF